VSGDTQSGRYTEWRALTFARTSHQLARANHPIKPRRSKYADQIRRSTCASDQRGDDLFYLRLPCPHPILCGGHTFAAHGEALCEHMEGSQTYPPFLPSPFPPFPPPLAHTVAGTARIGSLMPPTSLTRCAPRRSRCGPCLSGTERRRRRPRGRCARPATSARIRCASRIRRSTSWGRRGRRWRKPTRRWRRSTRRR